MARGVFRKKPLHREEQYTAVDDMKLRMTVTLMADRYSEKIREYIYRCYQDDRLAMLYRSIRISGMYKDGSKDKVRKKIVEFPNPYVYDFVDTVLTELYGSDWLNEPKALRHELVRPWWVVDKI